MQYDEKVMKIFLFFIDWSKFNTKYHVYLPCFRIFKIMHILLILLIYE